MKAQSRVVAVSVLILLLPLTAAPAADGRRTVVVSARECTVDGVGDGGLAVSAVIPPEGETGPGFVDTKTGMLLGVKTVDSHPQEVLDLVAAMHGFQARFGANRAGFFAEFMGTGILESRGEVIAVDKDAYWFVMEDGQFGILIAGRMLRGRADGAITFAQVDNQNQDRGDTGTHEVGHWLGLYHTFHDDTETQLVVAAPLGPRLEGYPNIAGLFRDTAEGETGRAHGHLDFIKKVGDPATGPPREPDSSFEASGIMTFQFGSSDPIDTMVIVDTDADLKTLQFDASGLKLQSSFRYRVLPGLKPARGILIHGPAQ